MYLPIFIKKHLSQRTGEIQEEIPLCIQVLVAILINTEYTAIKYV